MMPSLAVAVLSVFTPRIATLIMFATATLARKTGALPGWLVRLTYALGAFEFLNVTISEPAIYVFPAWVALVSVVLLRRKATGDLDLGPPPARGAA